MRWANRNERMEAIMNDRAPSPALPPAVDRKTCQQAREAPFAREKAHTREGMRSRRRLPMVEVDATIEVIGPHGPITILDVLEGRKQLIAYFHAWWPSRPAAEQCEGCTFFNTQVSAHGLLDMTVYGCQETWEDSPNGWPQPWCDAKSREVWRTNGRPIAQWSRIEAGRSGDLAIGAAAGTRRLAPPGRRARAWAAYLSSQHR